MMVPVNFLEKSQEFQKVSLISTYLSFDQSSDLGTSDPDCVPFSPQVQVV